MQGIRELVKAGKLSPQEALKKLGPDPINKDIVRWLKGAGKERYKDALKQMVSKEVEPEEAKVEEEPEEPKKEGKKEKKKDKKRRGGRKDK